MVRTVGAGVLLALLFSVNAQASIVDTIPLPELAGFSDAIFVGRVLKKEVHVQRQPIQISTEITFTVEEVWKGQLNTSLRLKQLGGRTIIDGVPYNQHVSGYPTFELNERVLVYLEKTAGGHWVIAGLSQGKFKILPARLDDPMGPRLIRDTRGQAPPVRARIRKLAGVTGARGHIYLRQMRDYAEGRRPEKRPVPLRLRSIQAAPAHWVSP